MKLFAPLWILSGPSLPYPGALDEIGLTWNDDEFILNFERLISENTNALVVAAGRSSMFKRASGYI